MVDANRLAEVNDSIREGELLAKSATGAKKDIILRSVRNAKIKRRRLLAGLPAGRMVWAGERKWIYEFEEEEP